MNISRLKKFDPFAKIRKDVKEYLRPKTKQLWEYRNIHFLTDFEVIMIVLNTILILLFTFYVGVVFVNIKFTNQFFTTSDYQCYDDTLFMGLGNVWTDQYYPDWWIFLSDFLYLLVPVYESYVLILYKKSSNNTHDIKTSNFVLLGTCLFFKALTLGIRVYQTIFCFYFQFCRICNSTCQPKFNCAPNSLWILIITFNVFWVLLILIYGVISVAGFYEKNLKEYRFQQLYNLQLNKFYADIGIPPDETVEKNYTSKSYQKYQTSYTLNAQGLVNTIYSVRSYINKKTN